MKRIKMVLGLLLFCLFMGVNNVYATEYKGYIYDINDKSFTYKDEDVSFNNVYFEKSEVPYDGLTSYGVLFGDMVNLSNHYLAVYITVDYYDRYGNIIARSTKREDPGVESDKYMMNIILYEKDFIDNKTIDDIDSFSINYYTYRGALLPNSNPGSEVISSTSTSNSITPSKSNAFRHYEYVIDSFDVNIKVNENNTFDIEETIDAYFNIPKHGIYREIPLVNNVVRLDGTTSRNRAKVTNVLVSDKFSNSFESGYINIKIGSENETLTGNKKYMISYNYDIGKDRARNYDELYFNIIGDGWDTVIGNITFTITMPKDFDETKLGFSSGKYGSTDSSKITYIVKDNVITGKYNGILNPGEAISVRLELPEGYFINAGYKTNYVTYLFYIVPIVGLIVSIILWYLYGKDDLVVETVEFYPPEGLNSLEIGQLYKGKATSEDVTSLLIYLANKGYIKINEVDGKGKKDNFEIIKLKDYDGNNYCEKEFLSGLFKNKCDSSANLSSFVEGGESKNVLNEDVTKVTKKELKNKFYKTTDKILKNINCQGNRDKIFVKNKLFNIMIFMFIIISVLFIVMLPSYEYGGWNGFMKVIYIVVLITPFYVVGFRSSGGKIFKIFWLSYVSIVSLWFFYTSALMYALISEPIFLWGFIIGLLCIIGMIICLKNMRRRTKYGNEMYGKIKGFKTFLETAEKENLERLVMQDPTYFYNILPFTYVLGVSKKWIKKFESISLQAPDWYSSSNNFTINSFSSFMNDTMKSTGSAMTPGSSSGSGGSSGGGSSGRGSGGGGGGSW